MAQRPLSRGSLFFHTPQRLCDLILLDHDVQTFIFKHKLLKKCSKICRVCIKPNPMYILRTFMNSKLQLVWPKTCMFGWINDFALCIMLYTSGPVSLKERLLYTLNKLFVKQVKSFLLLLDLDPFILLSSPHNIKYIKFTSP